MLLPESDSPPEGYACVFARSFRLVASFDPSTSITVVLSYRNITAGIDRIGLGAALPHLEMEVVAGRVSGGAHIADEVALVDILARRRCHRAHMAVEGGVGVAVCHFAVIDDDIVAVEATPGHDIGVVTLTGRLVPLQMRKANIKSEADIKRIYRKAKQVDMDKYNEAKGREHNTMIRARQIALNLNLNMKIGDVEYQGDGNKAIFYYIADERVDFRQLIKVLADAFHVRIEMKQIGARQEAGRIGGIGPCGRELCCATWMTSFVSVSTSAARYQDISLNPQKLAGQCAKLKCCLNYEVDCYVEAQKRLPSREIELETKDGTFYFFKADILSNQITYSTDKNIPANLVTISGKRAFEIIGMNKRGTKPESLVEEARQVEPKKPIDLLEQESLTRFDRSRKGKNGGENNGGGNGNGGNNNRKKKKKGNPNQPGDQQSRPRPQGEPRPQGAPKPQGEQPRQQGNQPRQQGDQVRRNKQKNRERGDGQRVDRGPRPNNPPRPQGEKPAGNEKPAQE